MCREKEIPENRKSAGLCKKDSFCWGSLCFLMDVAMGLMIVERTRKCRNQLSQICNDQARGEHVASTFLARFVTGSLLVDDSTDD